MSLLRPLTVTLPTEAKQGTWDGLDHFGLAAPYYAGGGAATASAIG